MKNGSNIADVNITPELIILNRYRQNKNINQLVNVCILIIKQYIYSSKCMGKKLKFIEATTRIYQTYTDKKYIAQQAHKLSKHNKKWAKYSTIYA